MRLQVILPTELAVDVTQARSYLAARYLLKNDMPIDFVVNDEYACPELIDIGLESTDDLEQAFVDVARDEVPDRGEESQFLVCGCSRMPSEVFTAAAEWFNHLATGRTAQGNFALVYVPPLAVVEEARRQLAVLNRVPGIAVNRIELSMRDDYLIGQPSRGPRFLVERSSLLETLESILVDLTDMDQAYSEEES